MKNLTERKIRRRKEFGAVSYSESAFDVLFKNKDSKARNDELKFPFNSDSSEQMKFHPFATVIGFTLAALFFFNTKRSFDAQTHYPHLSFKEQEILLPDDTAFLYSFYKRIASSNTCVEGLKRIIYDNKIGCSEVKNSFQEYSLTTEAFLGITFHLFKWLRSFVNEKVCKCWENKFPSDENLDSNEEIFCFYFLASWFCDSFTILLLFYSGYKLSTSIFGGISTALLFILLHPQRLAVELLFPREEKIGCLLTLLQLFFVSNALRNSHPSWNSVAKIGITTGLLILGWKSEAQWVLASQILLVTGLRVGNLISRHSASIVIFGQIIGWQYASLIFSEARNSVPHFSIFFYISLSAMITIFIMEPVLDHWILGQEGAQWKILRTSILFISFQILIFTIRLDLLDIFHLEEDNRLFRNLQTHHVENDLNDLKIGAANISFLIEKTENELLLGGRKGNEKMMEEMVEVERKEFSFHFLFHSFLISCHQSQVMLSAHAFLYKNSFIILGAIYILITLLILPAIFRKLKNQKLKKFMLNYNADEDFEAINLDNYEDRVFDQVALYSYGQFVFFLLFSLFLGKQWDILFIAQFSLIFSLIADEKVSPLLSRARNGLKWCVLNWFLVFTLISTFLLLMRIRGGEAYEKSRGHFEIGSQRVKDLGNALSWIEMNVEDGSCFVAPQNSLGVSIYSSTTRSSINHRLTRAFLWTSFIRAGDKIIPLNSPLDPIRRMEKVQYIFRRKSLMNFYKALISLNVTHLFVSNQICSENLSLNSKANRMTKDSNKFEWKRIDDALRNEDETIRRHKKTCDFTEFWDSLENKLKNNGSEATQFNDDVMDGKKGVGKKVELQNGDLRTICDKLIDGINIKPFVKVFSNKSFLVFSLLKDNIKKSK